MNRAPIAVRWTPGGLRLPLRPVTLDRLKKDEKFLEDALAANPELLGIQSRRSGIRGPYAVFQQVALPTPAGRTIYPDIVLLAGSGHLIVVEVKLSTNPELRDRNVIAQIIDYASSFSMLDDVNLLKVFEPIGVEAWADFVARKFPGEPEIEELAQLLKARAAAGEVNLVIACDRTPPGVEEVVAGIATQQTTGFDLDLVEVVPFVGDSNNVDEIVFVPSVRLSTEIVARTAVTVTYRAGDAAPSTSIETTSIEDVEANKKAIARSSTARVWPPEEVEEAFRNSGDPVLVPLLEFSKANSAEGQFVSPQVKSNATFGFFVSGRGPDGRPRKLMFFYVTLGWEYLWLNYAESIVGRQVAQEAERRLGAVFGDEFETTRSPRLKIATVGKHLDEFKRICLWLRDQAATGAVDRLSGENGEDSVLPHL